MWRENIDIEKILRAIFLYRIYLTNHNEFQLYIITQSENISKLKNYSYVIIKWYYITIKVSLFMDYRLQPFKQQAMYLAVWEHSTAFNDWHAITF